MATRSIAALIPLAGATEGSDRWSAEPGDYILVFEAAAPVALHAGRLGAQTLASGLYAYCGSAHGPGGLRARLAHHLRRGERRVHWHVDALTAALPVTQVLVQAGMPRNECTWVRRLLALPGATAPIAGFGSGDCREGCPAHLVRLPDGVTWGHGDMVTR